MEMTKQDINYAISSLKGKINSLRNDFARAYIDLNKYGIQSSPFPILMYTMSTLDFFSSLREGWSESNRKLQRFQTRRLINFCVSFLGYGLNESNILVKVHRHSLMHTSDPRIRSGRNNNDIYGWQIANINPNHMHITLQPKKISPSGNTYLLEVGIDNLINDLDIYLTKAGGYLDLLNNDNHIQINYKQCLDELDRQTI